MGVIINDFEIVLDQATEQGAAEAVPIEPAPSPQLSPQDITDIIRRELVRMERIRTY